MCELHRPFYYVNRKMETNQVNCIWKIPLVERCSYVCYTKFQVIAGAPEQQQGDQ